MVVRARMVAANGLEFGLLEAGTGPLALCLHGFPDSAHTWRHLLPALAEAGFHAVAPFYQQLKRFFYEFLFRDSLARAVELVTAENMAFLDRLWQDWSPGYAAAQDLVWVKESLRRPKNLTAAISYYLDPAVDAAYEAEEQAASRQARQPTLYLHGSADGCIDVELVRRADQHLAPGSRMTVVEGAGHFLHLERPQEVNQHILAWVTG